MPMIQQLLENSGMEFADLQGVAVASGPGSFTGLRIGMATAKGIAQVRNIPIVGINTLDALAQNGLGFEGVVSPILDARKDEVYTALYANKNGALSLIKDYRAVNPKELAEELKAISGKILFVGDAVPPYREMLSMKLNSQAVFLPDGMSLPRGANVGALAVQRFRQGQIDDLFDLKPFYIRPSEAEVTWAKKFGRGE